MAQQDIFYRNPYPRGRFITLFKRFSPYERPFTSYEVHDHSNYAMSHLAEIVEVYERLRGWYIGASYTWDTLMFLAYTKVRYKTSPPTDRPA